MQRLEKLQTKTHNKNMERGKNNEITKSWNIGPPNRK